MKIRASTALSTGLLLSFLAAASGAQTPAVRPANRAAARLAILAAEDRRAMTAADAATLRAGLRSSDAQTMRLAVRAAGRLERPDFIPGILPLLRHPLPEIRAEAANAVGQAARGWADERASGKAVRPALDAVSAALVARLREDGDSDVRSVVAETLGRLPYTAPEQVDSARRSLLDLATRSQSAADQLGVALGLEALIRQNGQKSGLSSDVLTTLSVLAVPVSSNGSAQSDSARDARVRRVSIEALIAAEAANDVVLRSGAVDRDAQVRRLTMKALSNPRTGPSVAGELLDRGLADASPMVRVEALRATRARRPQSAARDGEPAPAIRSERACDGSTRAVRDPDVQVVLTALDNLADCASSSAAIELLAQWAKDTTRANAPRSWHRTAHALVALASAAPDRAAPIVEQTAQSGVWQLRMYAARAAATLKNREILERLSRDESDNVKETAIDGLSTVAGHGADAVYLAALDRGNYPVVRAAALALGGTTASEAGEALKAMLRRLTLENHDNSRDVRSAIIETLRGIGVRADPLPARTPVAQSDLTGLDLRRLISTRARVTVRDVGSFELALLASEAPITAFRFARQVESGYYNGSSFHRVVPNFVIQGGSPAANEYVGAASFMRDEAGQWPHVRGAIGISTRGRDTGDAQFFVNLVDNTRLAHEYTVFAHVLNGLEVVDAILEGDIIERIELVVSR